MGGWIKLHRSILGNDLWEETPFARGQAWVDLLLMANHADKGAFVRGELLRVKRGELLTSRVKLCERWGWSNTKVDKFLALLENAGMISKKTSARYTLINISNYAAFQGVCEDETEDENAAETPKKTQQKRSRNAAETHEQECKECKEDTPPPIVPPQGEVEKDEETGEEAPKPKKQATLNKTQAERFNRFWAAYPRKTAKGRAERAWKTIDPDDAQTDAILAAIRAAKQQDRRFRETQYTPHPTTWLNGKEWENQYEGESGAQYISPIDALANREFVLEVD